MTNEQLALEEIQKAVTCRKAALRNMRSHKPNDPVFAALAKVEQFTLSYPHPTNATLQRFLLHYRRELDLVLTGDEQGRNRLSRIRSYVTNQPMQLRIVHDHKTKTQVA